MSGTQKAFVERKRKKEGGTGGGKRKGEERVDQYFQRNLSAL
jgi:hypothetical protein